MSCWIQARLRIDTQRFQPLFPDDQSRFSHKISTPWRTHLFDTTAYWSARCLVSHILHLITHPYHRRSALQLLAIMTSHIAAFHACHHVFVLTQSLFRKNGLATASVLQLSNPVLTIPGTRTIGYFFFRPYCLTACSPTKKSRESNAFRAPSSIVMLFKRSRGSSVWGNVVQMSARSPLR